MTETEYEAIVASMPDGMNGFVKSWGLRQFADKVHAAVAGPSTPSSHWRAAGEPDPHAGHYDGERAKLMMGNLTDDELANGAFMNYDAPLDVAGILAGKSHSPIAWMTAVKDRIRWLSRALERAIAEAAPAPAVDAQPSPVADHTAYAIIDSMGWDLDDQEKDDMLALLRAYEKRQGIAAQEGGAA